jgi:hypothetical protein
VGQHIDLVRSSLPASQRLILEAVEETADGIVCRVRGKHTPHCAQNKLPITVVGAGLPQLRGLAGSAKSYAKRLFDFPTIGPLKREEAELAILKPARDEGEDFTPEAVVEIISQTRGYPYFLQEWGKHSWDVAEHSPIALDMSWRLQRNR